MRWRVIVCFLGLVGLGLAAPTTASEPELVTDRPDQTESAGIVPPGLFQLEAGFTFGQLDSFLPGSPPDEVTFLSVPQSLLRFGVNKQFELRFGFDGYGFQRTESTTGSTSRDDGFSQTSLGFKVALSEETGAAPQVAFLGTIFLPIGSEVFRPDRADPSFRFLFANTLTERLSIGYNLGMVWVTTADGAGALDTQSLFDWTVALGIGAGERLGFFAEFYGLAGASASVKPLNAFDAGVTYLLTPRLQVDASFSFGLSSIAPEWTLGGGVSYRFPRFKG